MKFKSLLLLVGFIPALAMAEGAQVIAPPVVVGTPSAGTHGANGDGVVKPTAPVAVKPATVPAKTSAPETERERVIIPGGYNPVLPGAPNFNGY